jgi:hypothetical protein
MIRLVAGPSSAWSYAVAALGRATGRSRGGDAVPSRGELTENLIRAIVYKNNLGTAFLVPGRWQEQTLRVVATMAALAGDHRRAAILADLIAEQDEQDEARRALAITAAGAGDHDRAQAMINLIQMPRRRTQALADVALATLCLGNPDRATVVTQAINDRGGRDRALADMAAAAALLGDRERAETMVRSVSDQNVRASALATLAVVSASHGDYRRAETLARSITEHRQVEALSVVAAALAIAGEYDRAEELARSLPDSTKQVTALAQVADWAPPATARRLLAEALYRGRATIVLGTVARIDAHVTATVCEKLRELAEATSTPSQSPA